jgi:hypothetical protein
VTCKASETRVWALRTDPETHKVRCWNCRQMVETDPCAEIAGSRVIREHPASPPPSHDALDSISAALRTEFERTTEHVA